MPLHAFYQANFVEVRDVDQFLAFNYFETDNKAKTVENVVESKHDLQPDFKLTPYDLRYLEDKEQV